MSAKDVLILKILPSVNPDFDKKRWKVGAVVALFVLTSLLVLRRQKDPLYIAIAKLRTARGNSEDPLVENRPVSVEPLACFGLLRIWTVPWVSNPYYKVRSSSRSRS